MAVLTLVGFALMLTTQDAMAMGASLPSLSMPSLARFADWLTAGPTHWGKLPRQASGSAAGHGHYAPASATKAHRGRGHRPGKGKGELPSYAPYARHADQGLSHKATGFSAKASRRIAAKSSATSDYFENVDGSVTRKIAQRPVNYRDSSGAWQPIDTGVQHASDGRWHEKANSLSVDFASSANDKALTSFAADGSHSLSYGLQGAAKVAGTASGSTVTYPGVLPDTDLALAPLTTGVKEWIVLHSARAANSWTFPLQLKGLTPVQKKDGSIALVDASGKTVAEIPHAYAYDSKVDPRSGDPATTHAVTYQLVHSGGQWKLKVTLNAAWLHNPARVFPVTVDPEVQDGWTTTYAESGSGNGGDHSYEEFLKIGSYDSGAHSANSFVNHWYTSWDGSGVTVTAATLNLFDTWASTCTAERFDVAQITQSWTPSSVTAYPGPSYGASIGNATPTVSHACANTSSDPTVGDWVSVPLSTSSIQGWMNGTTADYGLAVYASTTDSLHWKKFGSFMDPKNGPWLDVTYTGNSGPQLYQQYPNNNAVAYTTTPELTAWAAGANSTGSSSTLKYDFTVYDNTNTKLADSGQIPTGDWTVPAGKLTWGQTYYWRVQAYDASIWSPALPLSALNIQVPQPLITSGLSQNSSEHGFDPAIGNYTTSDIDASVSNSGPALDVDRDYNSRDPRWTGAFGAGWSSVFDAQASEQYNASGSVVGVTVTYPDGSQVGYGKNGDGSFSPPSGRWASFKSITGGYSLTDKNDTVYTFTQSLGSGAYGITSITDANGRALNFTWSGGHVSQMASAVSGRSLYLTWSTPTGANAAHVATVHSDPVSGTDQTTDLTWTYGYSGDQLTSVCAPTDGTKCTTYAYGSGSQYQNASLDLAPYTMWPMSEASGTTAKDAVLANEGTTNATYNNVTLGQPGPLTGGSATAAGFNGTSSNVVLPNNLGNNTSSGALSMWFKTSSGPGVLYSYASTPVSAGSATGYYTPSIYVGSDGKLNAEFWYSGGAAPIVSSSAVTDGKWHHVVLSAAGNSQSLFLDNTKVGTLSGTVSIQSGVAFGANQPFNYIGTGFLGGGWPDEPNYSTTNKTGYATYFNGSIADVSWYNRPLVASDVNALYQYGTHAASLLTTITRPSGSKYAQVAYDPATTAVTQLTDENGGVWKLAAPSVTGSSQTYRGAVLGGGPAGYWRLGDAAGSSAAADEVRGGTGTYNAVTLGAAGPFSDQSAASFNGTSSYLQLPASTATVTTGPNSVEMWFKMPSGNTAGGVLFDEEQCAITNNPVGCGGYNPALYVGTDGKLYGKFWDSHGTSNQIVTSAKVNDGQWHHVMLAASTSAQVLYLDGNQAGTTSGTVSATGQGYTYIGAGAAGGNWTNHPTNTLGYFPGSIAEVAFYRSQLTAQDAQAHFAAGKNSSGLLPVSTVAVTDPGNATLTYRYDVTNGYRKLSETDGLGNTTSYGYDTSGFEHTVTAPNGATTTTGHDVRGNTVSTTTCQNQAANTCSTEYFSYYPDDTTAQLTTADPRNDLLLTRRDGRSSSATDTTYLTSYGYDAKGNQTTETTPAVAGFPSGRTTTTTYSDGTSTYPAADSGNVPAGLPVKTVSPGGAVNTIAYLHNGDVASTTDADGLVTQYTYDGVGRVLTKTVVSDTYPSGLKTSYVYDAAGKVTQETEPTLTDRVTGAQHTPVTSTTYDADGNVTSQTVSDATGGDAPRTISSTYNQYDQVATEKDANANAAATNGATTTYSYDAYGNRTQETHQDGTTTAYTYDAEGHLLTQTLKGYTGDPVSPSTAQDLVESSRAYDPAGRLASITDAMGNTTSYTYLDDGLVATITKKDSSGQNAFVMQSNQYDAAGNLTQRTTNNGATVTQYQVDAASRTTSTTVDPTGVNRVTQVSYTPDDLAATTNQHDSSGAERVTTATYDPMGHATSRTVYGDASGHPSGWWKLDQTSGTTVADASGTGNTASATGVAWGNSAAAFNGSTGQQIATNGPVLNTTGSYTVSAWVDMSSLPTHNAAIVAQTGTQNSAFMLQYNYAHTNAPLWGLVDTSTDTANPASFPAAYSTSAPTTGTWTHLVGVYNVSTGAMQLYVNGALAGTGTNSSPWNAGGPLTIGADKYNGAAGDLLPGSVSNVQVYPRALSASEVTTLYGNGRTGGTVGSSNQQTTKWSYDERGLPTSTTDPNGNTTNYSYDEAGNLAVTTAPAASVETDGGTPVTAHPITTSGFNTFGEAVEETDPNNNENITAYDANGNKVSETQPNYTPPGSQTPITATSTWAYDSDGNVTSETKPDGEQYQYLYDQMGDVAQVTDPNGAKTHSTYDTAGDPLSVTDGTGAQTQATYDWMGRKVTETTLERFPSSRTLTSTLSYAASSTNPGGAFLAGQTSPEGRVTSYGHDNIGEPTALTDGAGNTTRYSYDFAGRRQKTTLPDGTYTTTDYNASDLPTASKQYDASSTLLAQTSQDYDGNGNVTSATDANGHTSTFTYDATGMVTQEVQPVDANTSITTSFGYDAAGHRTRFTDGRGNNWITNYNSYGLPESVVAPTTSTYTSAADSTTTYSYNGDGQLVHVGQPGNVSYDINYDKLGNVTQQSGSGAEAATATRSFTYDANNQVLTAATAVAGTSGQPGYQAATNESFTYDDRGDLLTASGTAGSSSFAYGNDGLMSSRTDAAGTTSYTYDNAGRLATLNDPATGANLTYTYNSLSQPATIQYGSTGQTRTYTYNSSHELTGDSLKQGSTTLASISYGYDLNGNLTSKNTTGVTGASNNTYAYDWANRLTSWNNGASTTAYAYDASGNRTRVGSNVYTYDARDQLTSDGTNSYSYTARGTLSQQTGPSGTQSFTSDAYGQQITADTQTYGLDAFGRVMTDTTAGGGPARTLQYSGADNKVASDGSYTYTYDPTGGLIGINNAGATDTSTGRLAMTDQHDDVVATFAAGASTLAGSTTYDPLGNTTASSNTFGQLGYQSGWTDSNTGKVNMAARWYNPATGQFMNKDTMSLNPLPNSAAANPFAYVDGNPLTRTDPSGHGWFDDLTSSVSNTWDSASSWASSSWDSASSWASDTWDTASSWASSAWDYTYHAAATVVHRVVRTVRRAARYVYHHVRDAYRWTVHRARRIYHWAARHVRHYYRAAVHYARTAYHAVARVARRVIHAAAHVARTAYRATVHAVKTAAKFVKHHAAAITSFVASTAVFVGCEAVTAGIGTVGCAALSGAVGGLVEQGFKCAQGGGSACSLSSFGGAALAGGIGGALGGALGAVGGKIMAKVMPKALDAVGGLFGRGASEAADAAAGDATDAAASRAASDSAGSSTEEAGAGRPSAGEDAPGKPVKCETHSFTGATRVLMAGGTAKAIDQVKVGDVIANSVPGAKGVEAHKVTAVIVTRTDHDFVDLTIKKTTAAGAGSAAKAGAKAAAKSLAKKAVRKAAFGLAASAAVLGALGAGHGHGHGQQPATAPVAAVSAASSTHQGGAGAAEADDLGARLTTTFHHPFYDETRSAFVDAQHLTAGDVLQTPTGTAEVTGVRLYHAHTITYDLTIGTLHTYYVEAGDTPVLVHNCDVYEHGNAVRYHALDDDGRATGVSATITKSMLRKGTPANKAIDPSGWSGNGSLYNEARGHLLADKLGGSGDLEENLVTLTQDPINTPIMRDEVEKQVADAVDAGETIQYNVRAIYDRAGDVAPIRLEIRAYGNRGFKLERDLPNPAGMFHIDE
ncbi:LamG-like jellyroll fold domain-containing protein [Streptomyces sp. NPDC046197]|uniref:LamG-like jellyroll fold domain-containing protein n=1 Tax=Streptomyces sp. NPDC046197 TaxID=3154337 RepID=UPI0033DA068A